LNITFQPATTHQTLRSFIASPWPSKSHKKARDTVAIRFGQQEKEWTSREAVAQEITALYQASGLSPEEWQLILPEDIPELVVVDTPSFRLPKFPFYDTNKAIRFYTVMEPLHKRNGKPLARPSGFDYKGYRVITSDGEPQEMQALYLQQQLTKALAERGYSDKHVQISHTLQNNSLIIRYQDIAPEKLMGDLLGLSGFSGEAEPKNPILQNAHYKGMHVIFEDVNEINKAFYKREIGEVLKANDILAIDEPKDYQGFYTMDGWFGDPPSDKGARTITILMEPDMMKRTLTALAKMPLLERLPDSKDSI
jgi:hypothetical protein